MLSERFSPIMVTRVPGAIWAASMPPESVDPPAVATMVAVVPVSVLYSTALPSEPGARAVKMIVQMGKDKLKLTADWGRKISAYFKLHQRYPKERNKAATVKVSLVLNRRGNVIAANVAQSSGDTVFDDAAISMIKRSDPVPAPPAALTDDVFSFSLDVNFTKPK